MITQITTTIPTYPGMIIDDSPHLAGLMLYEPPKK